MSLRLKLWATRNRVLAGIEQNQEQESLQRRLIAIVSANLGGACFLFFQLLLLCCLAVYETAAVNVWLFPASRGNGDLPPRRAMSLFMRRHSAAPAALD